MQLTPYMRMILNEQFECFDFWIELFHDHPWHESDVLMMFQKIDDKLNEICLWGPTIILFEKHEGLDKENIFHHKS